MTKETKGTGESGKLGGVPQASAAEAAIFDLKPHLVKCMLEEPFYSKVLRTITKIRTDQIPTAGVLAKEGDIKMWWNPGFFAALTAEEIKSVIKHECLHLVFEHTTNRKHLPHLIWNYATDLAINSFLADNIPTFALVPGRAFPPLTTEQEAEMSVEGLARRQALSDLLESFPMFKASEWYFARLLESDVIKDWMDDQKGDGGRGEPGEGDCTGDGGGGGPGGTGEEGDSGMSGGGPSEGMPDTLDDHGGWDDMSDEDKEFIKAKIKQAAKDAARECDAKGGWGSIPAELRQQIRQALSNEVPWQSILKRFVGYSRRSNRTTSWSKIHSSYGAIVPGVKRGYESSIAVYIDQSGSVGGQELELLFAELRSLAKRTEFTTFHFDCTVDLDSKATWRKGKLPEAHRTRSGGTCFKAPTVHANNNKKDFDGYIILTDGYASQPPPSHLTRAWVITPDGAVPEWMENSKDVVIKMGWPADRSEAKAA